MLGVEYQEKKDTNHFGLTLLPMTFRRMRHAMKQRHKIFLILLYHESVHKRPPSTVRWLVG